MLVKKVVFSYMCNCCGKDLFNGTEWVGFSDMCFVEQQADEENWITIGKKHYCDSCYYYDDNDEIQIKNEEFENRN